MKLRTPRMPKTTVRKPNSGGGLTAFGGSGGVHAFRDPATMAAPDQAFSAAMSAKGSTPSTSSPGASSAPSQD